MLQTSVIERLYLGEDLEGLAGITTEVLHRTFEACAGCREGLAVGVDTILVVLTIRSDGPTPHDGLADDQSGLADGSLSLLERCADLVGTATIDLDDVPAPSLVLSSYIFAVDLFDGRGELDIIGIIVHDEVVQPQMPCDTTCTLGDLLLDTTIGDIGVDRLAHDPA